MQSNCSFMGNLQGGSENTERAAQQLDLPGLGTQPERLRGGGQRQRQSQNTPPAPPARAAAGKTQCGCYPSQPAPSQQHAHSTLTSCSAATEGPSPPCPSSGVRLAGPPSSARLQKSCAVLAKLIFCQFSASIKCMRRTLIRK